MTLPPQLDATYREHADFVFRVASQLGVARGQTEDIVHEVFLVVARRLGDYDGRSMRSWLYGITRRVVAHYHRSASRARRIEGVLLLTRERDPEERAVVGEAIEFVESFVGELQDDQRVVFVLAELEGVPIPEIAAATGVNLNTVYSRSTDGSRRPRARLPRLRSSQGSQRNRPWTWWRSQHPPPGPRGPRANGASRASRANRADRASPPPARRASPGSLPSSISCARPERRSTPAMATPR